MADFNSKASMGLGLGRSRALLHGRLWKWALARTGGQHLRFAFTLSGEQTMASESRNQESSGYPADLFPGWLVCLVVSLIGVALLVMRYNHGWIPHDDGTLGQAAERALRGELPNVDFDDYTGGLSFVHAFAFRIFGVSAWTMRVVLLVFAAAWIPAVFYVASRFCSAFLAGVVTLAAVAWSVPNYPGPMPSWYNVFFATFGTAALLRYIESKHRSWLAVAGLCAGFSALAKITAVYFVAGALLFFVFREQCQSKSAAESANRNSKLYSAGVTVMLVLFVALLYRMIHRLPGANEVAFFVFPAAVVTGLLIAREFSGIPGSMRRRLSRLMGMCVPFGIGFVSPILAFLVPYVQAKAVWQLFAGLALIASLAIRFEVTPAPAIAMILTAAPIAFLVLTFLRSKKNGRIVFALLLAGYLSFVLSFGGRWPIVYALGWFPLATGPHVLVAAVAGALWSSRSEENPSTTAGQQLMLLATVTALCSVIQFPFSAPVYFLFVAPFVLLLAAAFFRRAGVPAYLVGLLAGFYLLFAVLPGTRFTLVLPYATQGPLTKLMISRGGILVPASDEKLYTEVVRLIQAHAKNEYIYAAPDCPELYFLTGLKSPTRHYFEFAEDEEGHAEKMLRTLTANEINVVAINRQPLFAKELAPDMKAALEQRYPYFVDLAKFQVRWKE